MRNHMTRTGLIAVATAAVAALAAGACGSPQRTDKKGMSRMAKDAPPPPSGGQKKIDRKVTREAQKDFADAYAFYQEQAKGGWSDSACSAAAARFESVAEAHDKVVEAWYNAGLSYHHCGMLKEAEDRYQKALRINPGHAPSLTGLGEIYYRGGNERRGEEYWNKAVQADPKTTAARNNLAWVLLSRMRNTKDKSTWSKYEADAKGHLSRVLAVDNDNIRAYVIYALLYMEGADTNKSRLDLANLLLDEGAKRNDSYPPLWNARGLLHLRRKDVGRALSAFEKAVGLDPKYAEARMNVGNIVLGFRKYDAAKEQFTAVLEMQPKNYDAVIGLGIAQRGLGDLDGAEASYKKAMQLDQNRGAAYFNLGVLYKDFRASKGANEKEIIGHYKEARTYFRQFMGKRDSADADKKEAEGHIEDCDKAIAQLEENLRTRETADEPAGGGKG